VSSERKIVSVLFADLTDSTKLATALDPERFREVQSAFYRAAAECIGALRGRVEKFVGDAVMAVFGIPHAHDDDALRAIRAGWEIRERAARLSAELGLAEPIRVRIGVDSGPAVVGEGPADQLLVSGATVNLAARLQQAAAPGEILAGETTRQLTASFVAYGDPRDVSAKGFAEPVTVWPVAALSERSSRRTIPLVGRRRELTLLNESLARARESSRLHLVTVLGEPGIGKSRLVDEFLECLDDDVRILRARVSRFEEDAPFAPLVELIRREIGAEPNASPADQAKLLRDFLGEIVRPEEFDATAARLELTLGISGENKSDRPYRAAMVRAGVAAMLDGLAVRAPLVLTFEEMELARPELLDLIEQLAARCKRTPAVMLCVGRDEMLETRPGWSGGLADAFTIRLEPLTGSESLDLARAAAASLDEETAQRVARHAGGNPFFIVETTGMLLHERTERPADGPTGEMSPPLPATVQAVVAARIDHLDADSRELVRKASVFARSTFHTTELAIVAHPTDAAMARLEDEELLARDRDRPDVWHFNHEMVRAVAYDSLPKRERLRLHLALADRIEAEGRFPAALAYHLERAARASLDLEPGNRTVAERAAAALLDAGDVARRRMEQRTAIDLYERSLSFAEREERWGTREAHVLCGIGEACYWLGDFPRSRRELERALAVAPDDLWTRCVANRFVGDIALNVDADLDSAEERFVLALAAARDLGAPDREFAVARTLLFAGWVPYMRHDFPGAIAAFTEALETARANPEEDPWAEARALTFLANTISNSEPVSVYRPLLEEALAIGRRIDDPFSAAVAEQHYANALAVAGDLEGGLEHALAAVATFRELGAQWEAASAMADAAELLRYLGKPHDSERMQREAFAICRTLGERQLIGWIGPELALSLRDQGRHDEARAIMEEVAGIVDLGREASAHRAKALLAHDDGDVAAARAGTDGLLALQGSGERPNAHARAVWFTGRVVGTDAAGGEKAVREARDRLKRIGWTLYLDDPTFPTRPLL
jgi:class 3 adenylate cyclase/tetratricopeptide (TPR) repeat protein